MLLHSVAVEFAQEGLTSMDFFRSAHRIIFAALLTISNPDEVLLRDRLEADGKLEEVGGSDYIHELASGVPSAANVEQYIEIVKQRAVQRRMIEGLTESLREAEETGFTAEIIERAKDRLTSLDGRSKPKFISFDDALNSKEGEEVWELCIPPIQRHTKGIWPGGIVLISGGEGAGKTTLLMQILLDAADKGNKVFVWCKDQPCPRVARLAWAGFNKVTEAPKIITGLPIYFDANPFTLSRVCATMRRAARNGTRWFAIDYLSLMDVEKPFRAEWESAVYGAGKLKLLAEELNIYLLVIQSATEQESDSSPRSRNVFGGRQLRHHADQVWWLQQPPPKSRGEQGGSKPTILYVFKNRNGPVCKVELDFQGAWHRFAEWPGGAR
jgi:replicative DNA helicase